MLSYVYKIYIMKVLLIMNLVVRLTYIKCHMFMAKLRKYNLEQT
jgi:hypothetical protein